ncbi:MAG TPA: glutaredoxin family protein [Candidatus Acidoferrum sp.]|nr:glutaredoxin family protein [Candidatus Acidoferrum sp.]
MQRLTIKLFSHNECVHCLAVRRFLIERHIHFEEVDVEQTPGALQELTALTGSATHVPLLTVNQETFIALGQKTARRIIELSSLAFACRTA